MMRLIFLIALGISCSVQAMDGDQNYKEQIESTQKKLVEQEEKKRKVLADLYQINQSIKKIQYRKERSINEIKFFDSKIKKANFKIIELEKNLGAQQTQLNKRLRSLYKFSGHSFLRAIFSTQSPGDLDRNLKMLKIVSDRDYKLLRSYEKNKMHYGKERKRLRYMIQKISQLEGQIKEEEKLLVDKQNAKANIISNLDESTIASLLELKDLRSKIKITSGVAKAPGISFMESKGQLRPPVSAVLEKSFGVFEDKKFKTKTRFKGILYKTVAGQNVNSVYKGKVVFSGFVQGHGTTVVVSHGNHYYTVYSNLSKANVSNGQMVGGAQSVGEVGKNSQLYGQNFYFEIRHFSDPLDPTEWINHEASSINANTNTQKEEFNYGS